MEDKYRVKDKYRELFDEVHLSEEAISKVEERAEKLRNQGSRKTGGKRFLKAAALLGVILALGGTVSYAVTYIAKEKSSIRLDKNVQDKCGEMKISKEGAKDKKADGAKTDSAFYDVKLSYIPKGYKQDSEDAFLYRDKKGEGYFCVILYHLQTEYKTRRPANKIKEFKTKFGRGYYGGRDAVYFAILAFEDKDYMVYIDGSNMSEKEVKKIAEGSSLIGVEKKADIQASYIEWTEERQKETDRFMAGVVERAGKRAGKSK